MSAPIKRFRASSQTSAVARRQAERFNALVSAANRRAGIRGDGLVTVRDGANATVVGLDLAALVARLPRGARPGMVNVRNDTGAALAAFDAVALGDPVVEPDTNEQEFLSRPRFAAVLTGDPLYAGRLAIVQDDLPADAYGLAIASGVSVAKVIRHRSFSQWNQNCDRADLYPPTAGVTGAGAEACLRFCELGRAEVLWHEDLPVAGPGVFEPKWAIVRLGGQRPTQGVSVAPQGQAANRGVCEVFVVKRGTVAEIYPGCVMVTP